MFAIAANDLTTKSGLQECRGQTTKKASMKSFRLLLPEVAPKELAEAQKRKRHDLQGNIWIPFRAASDSDIAPLNEQRRIVEKIETLFARLDKGEEALRDVQKLLARYRQSVLKAAVTGQLTADWRAENAHRLEHGQDLLARILQTRRETWEGRGKYKEPCRPRHHRPAGTAGGLGVGIS
jgi:hypothetical protein